MNTSMLERMENLIKKIENMPPEDKEQYLFDCCERAKPVLEKEYNEERDFKIVGEKEFYE